MGAGVPALPMLRSSLLLACIVALYLGVRILILWTAFDTVAMPNYELMPMGNLARVLSEGWRGAPLDQYYDNCGGHLVTGILAAPLYAWFGDSYLVLKMVPLLLGVVDLLMIWSILQRGFGTRAAVFGALLFTLGPPTLVKYSMLAKGNHFEGLTLQLCCLWAFQRMHLSERPGRWLHVLAVSAGLAISFYLGAVLWVVVLGVSHLAVRGVRPGLRDGAYAIPGFVIGLAPLLVLVALTNNRPGQIVTSFASGAGTLASFLDRGRELLLALPGAGVYPNLGAIPGEVAGWWALGLFAGAWWAVTGWSVGHAVRAWREHAGSARADERKRYEALRLLPLVLCLPAFFLAYVFGSFQLKPYQAPVEVGQFRYLVPHFTVVALLLGATVGLWRRSGMLIAGAALLPAVFLVPLVDWSFARAGQGLAYAGYDLVAYNNVLLRDSERTESGAYRWDLAQVRGHVEEFTSAEQRHMAFGLGHHLTYAKWIETDAAPAQRLAGWDPGDLAAELPSELAVDVARGAGAFLRVLPADGRDALRERLEQLLGTEPELAAAVCEGLAMPQAFNLSRNVRGELLATERTRLAVPAALELAWVRGRGMYCGRLLARDFPADLPLAAEISGALQPHQVEAHWFGFGWGWAELAGDCLPAGSEYLPQNIQDALKQGQSYGRERRLGGRTLQCAQEADGDS